MKEEIQRWEKIVELAQQEVDRAAQVFASLQAQWQEAQNQLLSLRNYQQEYQQATPLNTALQIQQLQSKALFMHKVNQAVQAQSQQVDTLNERVQKGREIWVEKRARLKALQTLLDNKRRSWQEKLDKREQKMLDELAAKNAHKRQGFP
ncbi:flagellar export protein FliJ [Thiomicrorhabdus heinhorstiae]|uniref:Flagellar FliJ protein n=1 Tax=Thiomicrorhabdus heinhorstiae TaxID=2748010 RepID=A0ABS0BX54_9GAMM|nr:flagellar export protein FliJ [Thiomicrorhabdus heinhorstiae]MBF6058377.1 flagellar export protein FliJ [Thiomicrorhabdus heinhorstiae]